jgi:alpha-tubulin suppressor-like RCC1 family protein
MVERQYRGAILSWGSGVRGELGLGPAISSRTRPTFVPFFAANRICVARVSAGKRHVIAGVGSNHPMRIT